MPYNIKVPYLSALSHKFGQSNAATRGRSSNAPEDNRRNSMVVNNPITPPLQPKHKGRSSNAPEDNRRNSMVVNNPITPPLQPKHKSGTENRRSTLSAAPVIPVKYRTQLPAIMCSRADASFWGILKQCVGKELSKITMPVVFNEPLSFIQRLAEYMEYAPLIDTASKCDDPIERMEHVAAFAISALSSNWNRIGKPFNPLLGETYELCRPDLGFRYVGEQVSHHPPITAFSAEGNNYTFHGSIQPKLKFWGKSVEIVPKGIITLTLHRYKETYTWQNISCVVHNVMVGTLWVEHSGLMEITCNQSNIMASLNFKSEGWFGKDLHRVEGIITRGKMKERVLYGSWVHGMYSCSVAAYEAYMSGGLGLKAKAAEKPNPSQHDVDSSKPLLMTHNLEIIGQRTMWVANPRAPDAASYYQFSLFAMCLNELLPDMRDKLPPTDSRFRPDIRSMEEGLIDKAAEDKNRVEEKQREARKEGSTINKEMKPRWFSLQPNPATGKEDWVLNYDYWKRNWKDCVNIF